MGKLHVDDFYNFHPEVLMASESIYDWKQRDSIIIRLYSVGNYRTQKIQYYVYVSSCSDNSANFTYFDCLQDAIDYYNKKLEEYKNLCS